MTNPVDTAVNQLMADALTLPRQPLPVLTRMQVIALLQATPLVPAYPSHPSHGELIAASAKRDIALSLARVFAFSLTEKGRGGEEGEPDVLAHIKGQDAESVAL